jgi:O-methyltransferase
MAQRITMRPLKNLLLSAATRLGYVVLTVPEMAKLSHAAHEAAVAQQRIIAERDRLIAQYRETHDKLADALDHIRRLKIKVDEVPEIDYQLLMEKQGKEAAFQDADAAFHSLYERVKPFSMTSIERLYAMYKATDYVVKGSISGDIVECGVWRGGSMMMAALTLLARGVTNRRLFLFDTFEGLPKPDKEKDIDLWGHSNYDEWTRHRLSDTSSDWAYASLDEVRRNMESTGYPMDQIVFVKGMVQDTIIDNLPEAIALLRLDTDWYDSTVCEMRHLYPRVSEQGVLIADDYGHLKGQRQAIDEYIADNGENLLLNRIDYSGRLAIKPSRSNRADRLSAERRA